MNRAQSPWDIVDQWLASYQAGTGCSEPEMRELRSQLARLNQRQLWRFLDWLGERRVRRARFDPGASDSDSGSDSTSRTPVTGFGLPRQHGGSYWRSRPRGMRRARPSMSA